MIFPLDQRDLPLARSGHADPAREGDVSPVQPNPFFQGSGIVDRTLRSKEIHLFRMVARRQPSVRGGAVVGEDHQPRGIPIQPSAWKQTEPLQARVEQFKHGLVARILGGGHIALRLIEHDVGIAPILRALSAEHHRVVFGINMYRGIADGRPVDRDPSCTCRAGAFTARSKPAFGQKFIQSHILFLSVVQAAKHVQPRRDQNCRRSTDRKTDTEFSPACSRLHTVTPVSIMGRRVGFIHRRTHAEPVCFVIFIFIVARICRRRKNKFDKFCIFS